MRDETDIWSVIRNLVGQNLFIAPSLTSNYCRNSKGTSCVNTSYLLANTKQWHEGRAR